MRLAARCARCVWTFCASASACGHLRRAFDCELRARLDATADKLHRDAPRIATQTMRRRQKLRGCRQDTNAATNRQTHTHTHTHTGGERESGDCLGTITKARVASSNKWRACANLNSHSQSPSASVACIDSHRRRRRRRRVLVN